MSFLTNVIQVSILGMFLVQCASSIPILDRCLGDEDSITRTDVVSPRKMLFPRDYDEEADSSVADRGGSRRSWLQTRQLGDIEFTNRYAELLKSKAKITSICSFLKRMLSSKKSGIGGESERLVALMKQYTCPNVYQ